MMDKDNQNTANRIAKIIIWLFVWMLMSAYMVILGMGRSQGTTISATIIGLPLFVFMFPILLVITSREKSLGTIIYESGGIFSGLYQSSPYFLAYLYIILLFFRRTRAFLLKLFDYPNIQSLLWGTFSTFLSYGPFWEDLPAESLPVAFKVIKWILFFPGKISFFLLEKIYGKGFYDSTAEYMSDPGPLLDFLYNALSISIAYFILKAIPYAVRRIKSVLSVKNKQKIIEDQS